jgi:6-phosphogluconolactonase
MRPAIDVFDDYEAMSRAAAAAFVRNARAAVREKGSFAVALAGGRTPARAYELLAAEPGRVPWANVHVFWGDERCVGAGDPRSNQKMARDAFLDSVPIPEEQIHPIAGDQAPDTAAERYEAALREFAGARRDFLDMVLLGLGENGHTASLFPHSTVLREEERWVVGVETAQTDVPRVTMTPVVLNRAGTVRFLVSGESKADVLRRVLEGPRRPQALPAQLILGSVGWLVDRAAARELSQATLSREHRQR